MLCYIHLLLFRAIDAVDFSGDLRGASNMRYLFLAGFSLYPYGVLPLSLY